MLDKMMIDGGKVQKKTKKTKQPKYSYKILEVGIDVDGDGVPDGDLVIRTTIKTGKEERVFVPYEKMKQIADQAKTADEVEKMKLVKENGTRQTINETQTLAIEDKTNFFQYVKQGAGMQIGRVAVDAAIDGLSGLFD